MSAPPARLRDLVAVEAQKAARQASTWVLVAIFLAYILLVTVSLALVLQSPAQQAFDTTSLLAPLRQGALLFLGSIFASIATLLTAVFACESMGQEFSRGTLRTLVLAGARRTQVPLAKLALLTLVAAGATAAVLVAGTFSAGVLGLATGEPLLRVTASAVGHLALAALVPVFAWGLLALTTTLGLRSLGGGLASTLSLLLAGDVLVSLFARVGTLGVWVQRVLPNTAIGELASGHVPTRDWLWLLPNLAFWLGGSLWWALRRLARLDLVAATR